METVGASSRSIKTNRSISTTRKQGPPRVNNLSLSVNIGLLPWPFTVSDDSLETLVVSGLMVVELPP